MAHPDPEPPPDSPRVHHARGWLSILMPMAERGGPVLSILLGILLVVVTWHLHGEVRRLRDFTLHILERLVACQAELARHCPADPDREGR